MRFPERPENGWQFDTLGTLCARLPPEFAPWGRVGSIVIRRFFAVSLFLVASAVSSARAQPDDARQRQAAAEAYDRGTAAYLGGEYAKAAQWFETAHRMSPAAPALMQAVRSHQRAGQTARAATLSLRLMQEYPDATSANEYAQGVLGELADQFFRVDVVCDCRLDLDGTLQEFHSFFLDAGTTHKLTAHFDTGQRTQEISGAAGENRTLEFEAPPPEPTPDVKTPAVTETRRPPPAVHEHADTDKKPLPPLVTFIGGGVTVALAAGSVLSLLDQNSKVDAFEKAAKAWQADPENEVLRLAAENKFDAGESAQTRTTILWIATGVVGAGTAVVAVFLTDWSGGGDDHGDASGRGDVALRIAPTPGGAFGAVTARW